MRLLEINDLRPGDSASCQAEVSASDLDAMAQLTRDHNPLHMDEEFAREGGFRGRVAHGLLPLGMISQLIGQRLPGPGSLWMSQHVDFVAPIVVGDRLLASVTVEELSLAAQAVVLETTVINLDTAAVVLRGCAHVRIARPQAADARHANDDRFTSS